MSIYAIGDLHLSFHENKPMSIFGENWENYEEKIRQDWLQKVKEEDTVLLPGDFSWSMNLKDTYEDFSYINQLPGKKLLLKGNHDYWWATITSMRTFLKENHFENIDFLYNNSYEHEGFIIAGTRGWTQSDEMEDQRLVSRELLRLELSIQDGIKKYGEDKPIIVCLHYPPITNYNRQKQEMSPFVKIMKQYHVKICLYGHLHSASIKESIEGKIEEIDFKLTSSDGLGFKLYQVI